MERIVERPGALDVHQASVTAYVRVWEQRVLREQMAEFQTTVHEEVHRHHLYRSKVVSATDVGGALIHLTVGSVIAFGRTIRDYPLCNHPPGQWSSRHLNLLIL